MRERVKALWHPDEVHGLLRRHRDLQAARIRKTDVLRGEHSIADVAYRETDEGFSRLAKGGPDSEGWAPRADADSFRLRRVRRCYDLVILDAGSMTENHRLAAVAAESDLIVLVAAIGEPQSELGTEVESAGLAEAKVDAVVLVDPAGEV